MRRSRGRGIVGIVLAAGAGGLLGVDAVTGHRVLLALGGTRVAGNR